MHFLNVSKANLQTRKWNFSGSTFVKLTTKLTLEIHGGEGCSQNSAYNSTTGPPLTHSSIAEALHPQIQQPQIAQYPCLGKNSHKTGPVQFKPMLFKGQLHTVCLPNPQIQSSRVTYDIYHPQSVEALDVEPRSQG